MRRLVLRIIFALGLGIALTNCDKVKDVNELDGTYVGTYTWTYLTNGNSSTSAPTIEFKEGKYTYNGLSNGGYFDGGYGNFTIKGNELIFELTHYDIPFEKIGVNKNWLLKGEYKCEFDGNKLILSKAVTNEDGKFRYEFELKRK
jgi:hypothetical protein